jgi:hypothetical protein
LTQHTTLPNQAGLRVFDFRAIAAIHRLVAVIGTGQWGIGKTGGLGGAGSKGHQRSKRQAIESKGHENFQKKN